MDESTRTKPVWPWILGSGCLVVLLLVGGVIYWGFVQGKRVMNLAVLEVPDQIVEHLEDPERAEEVRQRFAPVAELAKADQLALVTFPVVVAIASDVTRDQTVTADELQTLYALFDDIVAKQGAIDVNDYQETLERLSNSP